MTKDRRRKGKLRSNKPTPIDDELAQLASVIAEYQLDNTAYGWFRPPWRDGTWAVKLALATAMSPSISDGLGLHAEREASRLLDTMTTMPVSGDYERAGELYRSLVQPKINTDTARLLAAGLRCMQLKIAHSDGGGAVYNEVLIPAFLPLEPKLIESLVLRFRCLDSIGVSDQLKGDHNDRQRSAFAIAWKRGLYMAAYSIQPSY